MPHGAIRSGPRYKTSDINPVGSKKTIYDAVIFNWNHFKIRLIGEDGSLC